MIPTPRYAIGQTVYRVTEDVTTKRYPCPDCGDTKTWTAITAAGEEVKVPCCRCGTNWSRPDQVPPLEKNVAVSSVRALTIGSIRIDTDDDVPIRYMCGETGIGSGWLHSEADLYQSEETAKAAADTANAARQNDLDAQPAALRREVYTKLPLAVAIGRGWREEIYHAWDRARDLTEAVEVLVENKGGEYEIGDGTVDFLRETLHDKPSWRTPHPVDVLLEAVAETMESVVLPADCRLQLSQALALLDYEAQTEKRGAK